MKIANLVALKEQPDVLYSNGVTSELPRWSSREDQREHFRARLEAVALAEMSIEELQAYFGRHGVEAVKTWNRSHSVFGRLLNLLTVSRPGYAKVSGRVLRQAYDLFGAQLDEGFTTSAELYLRADIVCDIATLIQSEGADR